MPIPSRLIRLVPRIVIAAMVCAIVPAADALPDNLKLVVPTSDGNQTLNLHKRTVRTADCAIYQWSVAGGYVPITQEVRTYRGTVSENPNAIVIAAIDGSNNIKVRCIDMEWSHNFRWETGWVNVSSQLAVPDTNPVSMPAQVVGSPLSGSTEPAKIGPKVPTGVAANGVHYGSIVEYELGLDLTVAAYTRAGGNIDTVLAQNELDAMVLEMMMLRDVHVRVVTPTIVVRTENFYASDPGVPGLGPLDAAWKSQPLFATRWDGVWGSEGGVASGNGIGKDEFSVSLGAIYHEVTHTWTAFHLAYEGDTMGGNKPSIGAMTADTMLKKRKEAIDEGKLPVAAPFADPLPPHTHVDAVRAPKDTAIIIDVLANDHDANGDAISIHSFTTNTVPGGTVTLVGNTLRYTPPSGYVGKDEIVYTAKDSSAMGLKTREVVHIEVVSQDMVASYQMEETSGTVAANSVAGGVPGDLNGANFATDRVISPLGHGLRVNGFPDENAIEGGDWSGMLMGSGSVMPVPTSPGRIASPFDTEFNRHSGHFDIMDGDYTFATWFRSDSYNGADFPGGFSMAYIASRWWHPETRVGWDMYAMNGTIGLHYRIFDGSTGIQHFSAPYNLVAGRWYHMAAVFDRAANQIRILVNGQVIAIKTSAFASNGYIFNARAPLALGEFSRDKYCYDDVRIYTKALTTPEVQALVSQPGSGVPRFLTATLQYSAYAGMPFAQSLWSNIWSGGDDPLTFQLLGAPAWLSVDSGGFLRGNPTATDAGSSTLTVKITDSNGDTATATITINVPAVPTNPFAEWKLDEGSGATTADSSGHGYKGDIIGASWDFGHVDGSLSFNGAGNQVSCENVPTSSQMSFAAWIKPADVSGLKGIFGKLGACAIKLSGSNLAYTRPGVGDYYSSGAGLTANVWQHVVVTVNGGQTNGVKFYKNGVLVSQTTGWAPGVNSNPLLIGNNQYNEYFKGNLDHLQIFNSVLTADDVGALYASTYGDGVFTKWKFDEGSGLTAADSSGNGNTGTLDSGIGWVPGHRGNAVAMAATQKISLGGKPGPAGDWTFSSWVQRKGDRSSAILIDSGSTVIKLEQYSNTHRVGITRRGVADWSFNYTTPLNQWAHLTLVGGDGAVRLYVNGALQDTLAQSVSMPFAAIGSNTEGMNAWIDDVIVHDRMLSAQEVLNLYHGETNIAPAFTADPITGSGAFIGHPYSSSLASLASDPNGDALTFSLISGPTWLTVAANGALSGTPSASEEGINTFVVRVSDPSLTFSDATLRIGVSIKVNTPPAFSSDLVTKAQATPGSPYTGSLAADITDPDGDMPTFEKLSGPAWLVISPGGPLSGTPQAGDAGENVFVARVSDGHGGSDIALVRIQVGPYNYPVGNYGALSSVTTQDEFIQRVQLADLDKTSGDNNGYADFKTLIAQLTPGQSAAYTLTPGFTAQAYPEAWTIWIDLNRDGDFADTGERVLQLTSNTSVRTGNFTVPATASIGPSRMRIAMSYNTPLTNPTGSFNYGEVEDYSVQIGANPVANSAPYFLADPIAKPGVVQGVAISGSIAADAADWENNPITFSRISGPSWLQVAVNGTLTGTPGAGDIGTNNWTIRVSDGLGGIDTVTLVIAVAPATYTLTYTAGTNGTLNGTTPQMVNHGASGSAVTANPDAGYAFANWSDGSTANPRTDTNVIGSLTVTANFTATGPGPLPAPWTAGTIGTATAAVDATHLNGTFNVTGCGANISGKNDNFYFLSQPWSGNCTLTARVASLQNTGPAAKAGVMIRESNSIDSRSVFIGLSPTSGAQWVRRSTTGGNSSTTTSANKSAPYWVRLTRNGNTFTSYISANGTSWTQFASASISIANSYSLGLAICSGASGTPNASAFDNVSVTNNATAPATSIAPTSLPTMGALTLEDGTVSFNIAGEENGRWELQESSDLVTWTPLQTITLPDGTVQHSEADDRGAKRFFRLQSNP